jgi:AraC-like DNA-binding protein
MPIVRTSGRDSARRRFLALLDAAIARPAAAPVLPGIIPGEGRPGDPPEKIMPIPRWMIVLDGVQRIGFAEGRRRREVLLRRGEALHYPARAWDLHFWERRCRFLAVVYHRGFVRFLVSGYAGRPAAPPAPEPWLHTAAPIGAVGRHALAALDAAADGGASAPTIAALFRALLIATREHLAADADAPTSGSRAWTLARELIAERAGEPLSREQVAAAIGVHPGWLSMLCSRHGRTFRRLLEDARCERACRLLRSGLAVERVAALCGYATSSAFIRMFARVVGVTPAKYR